MNQFRIWFTRSSVVVGLNLILSHVSISLASRLVCHGDVILEIRISNLENLQSTCTGTCMLCPRGNVSIMFTSLPFLPFRFSET